MITFKSLYSFDKISIYFKYFLTFSQTLSHEIHDFYRLLSS